MIQTPDRLAAVAAAIEQGKPIDLKKVAALQALDLARAGRQFVEEAVKRHEDADEQAGRLTGEAADVA